MLALNKHPASLVRCVMPSSTAAAPSSSVAAAATGDQGLTLLHFPAHCVHFLRDTLGGLGGFSDKNGSG